MKNSIKILLLLTIPALILYSCMERQTFAKEDKLEAKGFLPERIIAQACPELARYIERGYNSDETEMLIYAYVDEALQKVRNHRSALYVSLNCTHYGYSLELWKKYITTQR